MMGQRAGPSRPLRATREVGKVTDRLTPRAPLNTGRGYRHDTPHRMVTANSTILGEDADGMTLGYDPGPCTIGGPEVDDGTEPYCNHDPVAVIDGVCECGEQVAPVYSWTEPCP